MVSSGPMAGSNGTASFTCSATTARRNSATTSAKNHWKSRADRSTCPRPAQPVEEPSRTDRWSEAGVGVSESERVLPLLKSVYPEFEADSPADALLELGSVAAALPYRWLYWPDVVEVADALFVDLFGLGHEGVENRLRETLRSQDSGRSRAEWKQWVDSFNYVEISYLFRDWAGLR